MTTTTAKRTAKKTVSKSAPKTRLLTDNSQVAAKARKSPVGKALATLVQDAAPRSTKADRVAALVSGAVKPSAKTAKVSSGKTVVVDGREMPRAAVSRLVLALGAEQTFALGRTLEVPVKGKRLAAVRKSIVAALDGREMPKVLATLAEERSAKTAKKTAPRAKSDGKARKTRISVMVELAATGKYTVQQIAEKVLAAFPEATERSAQEASVEQQLAYVRVALNYVNAGKWPVNRNVRIAYEGRGPTAVVSATIG